MTREQLAKLREHALREVAKAEAVGEQVRHGVGGAGWEQAAKRIADGPILLTSPCILLSICLPVSLAAAVHARTRTCLCTGTLYVGDKNVEGLPHGRGRRQRPSGEIYCGEFEAGKYHGYDARRQRQTERQTVGQMGRYTHTHTHTHPHTHPHTHTHTHTRYTR